MKLNYLHNGDTAEGIHEKVLGYLSKLKTEGVDVDICDTSNWSSEKKEEVYEQEITSKSIQIGDLREVRSRQDGEVRFDSGVLIVDDGFYVGEKVLETFEKDEEEFDIERVHTYP